MAVSTLVDDPGGRLPGSSRPLHLQILGPLRIWRDGVEVDAGPRQQAYLLALLLARAGRPTSTDELVSLIWGDNAPISALNVVHKYIGALRRLLEPGVAPRGSGSHLLRRGNGYLFTAERFTRRGGFYRLGCFAILPLRFTWGSSARVHRFIGRTLRQRRFAVLQRLAQAHDFFILPAQACAVFGCHDLRASGGCRKHSGGGNQGPSSNPTHLLNHGPRTPRSFSRGWARRPVLASHG